MTAAWMLYTLLVTMLLVVAGAAAERIARAARAPTRLVWASVVLTTIVLSGMSLLGARAASSPARAKETPVTDAAGHPPLLVWTERTAGALALPLARVKHATTHEAATPVRWLLDAAVLRLDQARWAPYDALLSIICLTSAVAGLLLLILSLARLRSLARALSPDEIEGVPVLLSRDIGPAVLGYVRTRVVLPRWIAALAPAERRTILLHEQEHAAARDPLLLLMGIVALALQPWNLPLWIIVARLRFALEADCDARVLARSRSDVRLYGTLLLQVHERELTTRIANRMSVTAFVDSKSHLERRVHRMIGRQPRVRSVSTLAAFVVAAACVGVALSVRVSAARSASRSAHAEPTIIVVAAPPTAAAVVPASDSSESTPTVTPRWQTALPEIANSEHDAPQSAVRLVTPAMRLRDSFIARIVHAAPLDASTPETLVVRASNPKWPMKARIVTSVADDRGYVVVTDTLGHQLPTADTLTVEGSVRLLLPDTRFMLRIESLSGDLSVTSSPVPAADGHDGYWIAEFIARGFLASREAAGTAVRLSTDGTGVVRSQRIH